MAQFQDPMRWRGAYRVHIWPNHRGDDCGAACSYACGQAAPPGRRMNAYQITIGAIGWVTVALWLVGTLCALHRLGQLGNRADSRIGQIATSFVIVLVCAFCGMCTALVTKLMVGWAA